MAATAILFLDFRPYLGRQWKYLRQTWATSAKVTGVQGHTFGKIQDGGYLDKIWHPI